jgi:hypothetical protein
MHSAAIELFQLLVQAGAVPGEDFSCDPNRQGYRLNQRSLELLSKRLSRGRLARPVCRLRTSD